MTRDPITEVAAAVTRFLDAIRTLEAVAEARDRLRAVVDTARRGQLHENGASG